MTSKISFSSLRRENIKHRIGMILITFFGFFVYILWFLMSVQNICGVKDSKFKDNLKSITQLSEPGMEMGAIILIAAVLLAISGFRYLHSKREVDFYHALPIRRRKILYVILTNDLMIFLAPLIITLAFKCIITVAVGYFCKAFFVNTLWSVICYTAAFLVTYLTMALAMIMTGNTFVGVLGFGVFASYAPIVIRYLYPELAEKFYVTYCSDTAWGNIFNYFSPVSLTNGLLTSNGAWTWKSSHSTYFISICVWIVLLLVLNYWLFEKRASEMAGKAMAFPKANPVIRILLVIPVAIWVGLILYSVSFTAFKPWIIVGIVVGGFFTHGVIECMYQFDVHGLWTHKKQMLLSMAAAFAIIAFFWMDVIGYDKYLPNEEEVASIVIDSPDIGISDDYFWGKERTGVTGETMKGTLKVLDDIVAQNDKNLDTYNNGSGDEIRGYNSCTIKYRLKNGKEKRRSYTLNPDLQDNLMTQVFDTEEYKKDSYSLYTADWSLVTGVEVSYPVVCEELKMTKEQRAELFRTYLEELSKLDYETMKSALPFGQLMITHKNKDYNDIYSMAYDDGTIDYYYIYPSFKKTIKFLREELKININTSMKDIDISQLDISEYDETGDVKEYTISDKEFIESVKDKLIYGEYMSISGFNCAIDTSIDIMATVHTEDGMENIMVYTDSDTVRKLLEHKE